MKTYVLTLSQRFPAKHPRKGEPTNFDKQMFNAVCRSHNMTVGYPQFGMKLHTIRANWPLWSKRFEQIYRGEACLSIRQWTGKPYASKQVELCRLTKDDGIGMQSICFPTIDRDGIVSLHYPNINGRIVDANQVATNDGLDTNDWYSWFRNYDLSKPLAIIHFTKFRY